MSKNKWPLLVLAVLALGGCATVERMPLQDNSSTVDESKKSILVAHVSIKNQNKTAHQPRLNHVSMEEHGESYSFTGPTLLSETSEVGKEYIVSMSVDPGKVKLKSITFIRQVPMLLSAFAVADLENDIDVPANKIIYLGNIEAVIVPRTSDSQPRAGSVIPLVDQSVAGFSSGTFKISVTDKYENDMKEIVAKFPAMAGKQVVKQILSGSVQAAAGTSN